MTDTWYLAVCVECNGGLMNIVQHPERFAPMPFDQKDVRTSWVNAHMEGTGHAILLLNQNDTTTNDKGPDDEAT